MDFRRPNRIFGPTLDGDVLMVLAPVDAEMTGRQVAARIGRSPQGALNALDRLVDQGIVRRRSAGRAMLYSFNRDHVAAVWIEGMTELRRQLLGLIRNQIESWQIPPVAAAVFGSVARGTAGPASDLDLLLVHPVAVDQATWDEQVSALSSSIYLWTGNDARPLVFGEDEITSNATTEPVIDDVLAEGIEVGGSLAKIRRMVGT